VTAFYHNVSPPIFIKFVVIILVLNLLKNNLDLHNDTLLLILIIYLDLCSNKA